MSYSEIIGRNYLKGLFWLFVLLGLAAPIDLFALDEGMIQDSNKDEYSIQSQVDSLNNISRDLTFVNPLMSLELANEALDLAGAYERGIAYSYRNLGNVYFLNEVYSPGTQYLKNAEDIFVRTQDTIGLADCYISYGHMYRGLHDIENEVEYFEKAYDLYKSRNLPDRLAICATNLAQSYFTVGNYLKSRELVSEAVVLSKETDQLSVLSVCYNLYGELELREEKVESAAAYFHQVLELTEALGENSQKVATIESLLHLSKIADSSQDTKGEFAFLNQALDYALQNELSTYIVDVYNLLITHHLDNNKLAEARKCMAELKSKSQEITSSRMQDQTSLVNNLITAHDLEKENQFLEVTNKMQKDRLTVRNIFLLVLALLVIVILFFSLNLFRANKRIKIQNIELQRSNSLINEQKKELAELLMHRDKLFSIIAHDLRNPFNAMLLTLEMLTESLKDKGDSDIKKRVDRITRSASSTYDLLEKLLMWARNQKENVHADNQELILFDLVNSSIRPLMASAHLKNIKVINTVVPGLKVICDGNMVQTVLRNLVQNALKFTNENGEVLVSAELQNNKVTVSVADTGIGIKDSVLPILFTLDKEKVRNGTSGESGTGLGLALCKQFVEKNGGEIWVESKEGKGTIVVFTLHAPIS